MKHTQGPWVVTDFCTEGEADVAVWTSHDPHTGKSICECHFDSQEDLDRGEDGCSQLEAEANAKLIAAAPILLEALTRLIATFHPDTYKDHGNCGCVLCEALAAIARVTA